jgi:hypothetical protein
MEHIPRGQLNPANRYCNEYRRYVEIIGREDPKCAAKVEFSQIYTIMRGEFSHKQASDQKAGYDKENPHPEPTQRRKPLGIDGSYGNEIRMP